MSSPTRRAASLPSLFAIAAIALLSSGCIFSIKDHGDCDDCAHHSSKKSGNLAHCPVTGESISKNTSPSATVDGDTYYFHCNTCKSHFLADPGAYMKGDAEAAAAHTDAGR